MAFSKSIEKLALGRLAQIGQFYDAKTDSFIRGDNAFIDKIDEDDFIQTSDVNIELVLGESIEEKFEVFGVDPQLKISILSGLVQLKNSSNYVIDTKKSAKTSQMTLIYSLNTFSQEIRIRRHLDKMNIESLKTIDATHLVVAIDWGCNCFITCEYDDNDDESKSNIQEQMEREVKLMKGILDEDNKQKACSLKFQKDKFSYKCKCDVFSPDNIPQTFTEALTYARSLPLHLAKINDGRGVPLNYHLLPISVVIKSLKLNIDINPDIPPIPVQQVNNFVDKFENITQSKRHIHDLVNEYKLNNQILPDSAMKKIDDFRGYLNTIETTLKEKLSKALIDIRSGDQSNDILDAIYDQFNDKEHSSAISRKLANFRNFINEKKSFIEHIEKLGILYLGRESNYQKHFNKNDQRLNVLYMNGNLADEKWQQNKELFLRLSQSYTGSSQYKFIVLDCELNYIEQDSVRIEMYKGGVMTCADYWEQAGEDLYKCQVRYKVPATKTKKHPNKGVLLRLPCNTCKGERVEWTCFKCKSYLYFNLKTEHLFCQCGTHNCSGVSFRCSESGHGLRFLPYEEEELRTDAKNMEPDSCTNILILGETGVGKSTWINAFANYLTYDNFASAEKHGPVALIPAKFIFNKKEIMVGNSDKCEDLRTGQSSTQTPVSHCFYTDKHVIRLIDTPGIGDVRGIEKDKENFENILSHLTHYKDIHAICILVKSNHSRLTISFRFCISELLVHLHTSASNNLIFCFTHARETFYKAGNSLPLLEQYLQDQKIPVEISCLSQYYFDSESFRFLAIVKDGIKMDKEDRNVYSASWDRAVKESERLLDYINKLDPHNTSQTISLNEARRIIIRMSKPLAKISESIQLNLSSAAQKQVEIKISKKEATNLQKDLEFQGTSVRLEPLPFPRTVCTHRDCVTYITETHPSGVVTKKTNFTKQCHQHCYLSSIPVGKRGERGLRHCKALRKNPESCSKCGHSYREHQHLDYDLKEEIKIFINSEVREKISNKKSHQEDVKRFIKSLDRLVEELKAEEKIVTKVCAQFACYLEEHALTPFNDAIEDHIMLLIEEREQNLNRDQMQKLKDMLENYKKERNLISNFMAQGKQEQQRITQPKEVKEKLEKLFNLKHNGEDLKKIFTEIEKIQTRSSKFVQRPYCPMVFNNRNSPSMLTNLKKKLLNFSR